MGNKEIGLNREPLWPSLVSIVAPLVQLLLVFLVSMSNLLNVRQFFFYPELLVLVNILVLFITISCGALFWYWRNNNMVLSYRQPKTNDTGKPYSPEKTVFRLILVLTILSGLLFLVFVSTVVVFLSKVFIMEILFVGIIQYTSYGLFLIFTGLVIYVWLLEYIKKRQTFQREDFIKNLLNTLATHELIKKDPVIIWRNNRFPGNYMSKSLEIEIKDQKYSVEASFDGLEIYNITKIFPITPPPVSPVSTRPINPLAPTATKELPDK